MSGVGSESGGAGRGGGGRARRWGRGVAVGAAAGLAGAWLATGFQTVSASERGVVTRFGAAAARVGPGIHFLRPWPIDRLHLARAAEVVRIEVGFTQGGVKWTEPRRSDMVTGDQNILKVEMAVQYRIRESELARHLFGVDEPRWMVERAVESALARALARRAVDDVLAAAKHEVETATLEAAQADLDRYGAGLDLLAGSLQTVSPPVPVLDAFTDVASASKDAERLLDEARAYESRALSQARGRAQQRVNEARATQVQRVSQAQGEAARFRKLLDEYRAHREVTRTRLFLDTIEQVMAEARVVIAEADGRSGRVVVVEDRP